jgi:hypothetical protein
MREEKEGKMGRRGDEEEKEAGWRYREGENEKERGRGRAGCEGREIPDLNFIWLSLKRINKSVSSSKEGNKDNTPLPPCHRNWEKINKRKENFKDKINFS